MDRQPIGGDLGSDTGQGLRGHYGGGGLVGVPVAFEGIGAVFRAQVGRHLRRHLGSGQGAVLGLNGHRLLPGGTAGEGAKQQQKRPENAQKSLHFASFSEAFHPFFYFNISLYA